MQDTTSSTAIATAPDGMQAAEEAFARILTGEPAPEEDEPQVAEEATDEAEYEDEPEEGEELEEDSDPDEEEQEGEEQEAEPVYAVKIDGQEIEVPLSELLKGYSRTQDYTKKTQAASELRKQAEAEAAAIRAERQQYAQVLEGLRQTFEANAPPEPDWDRLRDTDPIEFGVQWAEHQRRQQQQAAIRQEQARLAQIAQQEQIAYMRQTLEQEKKVLEEVIPEWRDPKLAAREKAELVAFGQKLGYTPQELSGVMDHRAVVALRNAYLYDKLMANKAQVKPVPKQATPTLKPGSAQTVPKAQSDLTRAKQRLAKTGSVKDAAAAFELLLKG